jgi:hypothetical protein
VRGACHLCAEIDVTRPPSPGTARSCCPDHRAGGGTTRRRFLEAAGVISGRPHGRSSIVSRVTGSIAPPAQVLRVLRSNEPSGFPRRLAPPRRPTLAGGPGLPPPPLKPLRRSPPQPRGHGGLQWRRRESNRGPRSPPIFSIVHLHRLTTTPSSCVPRVCHFTISTDCRVPTIRSRWGRVCGRSGAGWGGGDQGRLTRHAMASPLGSAQARPRLRPGLSPPPPHRDPPAPGGPASPVLVEREP